MFNNFRSALQKRRAYLRTKAEIESLPKSIAKDLNIDPACAASLAAKAVYG